MSIVKQEDTSLSVGDSSENPPEYKRQQPLVFFPTMGDQVPIRKAPVKPRPKKYQCTVENCTKAYTRPCLLEQHLRSHADERPFVCSKPECGKAFLRDSHLKAHMLSHSDKKPLSCSVCGKGFNTNQHLKRHVKVHFPGHVCTFEECGQAFKKQSQLRRHVSEVHEMSKLFPCVHEGCDKQFNNKSRREAHVAKNHSPFPQYHCGHEGCEEKLHTWSQLQNHIKNSHKKTPCQICGKPCSGPAGTAEHMKVHEQGDLVKKKEWHCAESECSMHAPVFDSRDRLSEHYQSVHGFVPNDLTSHDDNSNNNNSIDSIDSIESIESIERSRESLTRQPTMIERISGSGYENTGREIPCIVETCNYRFAREYDLQRHVISLHPEFGRDEPLSAATSSASSVASPPNNNDNHSHHENREVLRGYKVVKEIDNSTAIIDPMILNANA